MGLRRFFRERRRRQSGGHSNSPLFHYSCEFPAIDLMRNYAPRGLAPTQGVVTNYLGLKLEPKVMPSLLTPMVGTVEGFPFPGNWHADIAEWAAALLSVREAKGTYRIVEVGCGWGCWLNNMGLVAARQGLSLDLIGVEGDKDHLANAESTFHLNGISDDCYRLFNGVAAPKNGIALFPVSDNLGEDWGAEPIFYPDDETLEKARQAGTFEELQCYTLSDVSNNQPIDLLHIDIQGAELEFVKGNFEDISRLVKRVLIGTHSRYLEGALQEEFLSRGWSLEMDRPALCELVGGRPEIRIDGVLLFRSPNEAAPVH